MKTKSLFIFVAVIILCLSQSARAQQTCAQVLIGPSTEISAQETQKLKILVFNLNNVFIKDAAVKRGDVETVLQRADTSFKSEKNLDRERKIIKEQDPDIFIGTEMHLIEDAKEFMKADPALNNKYWVFLKEGNDDRGINIVTYVKKSLGFRYKLTSYKDLTWKDPVTKKVRPLFSRDLPVLTMSRPGESKPTLIVIGNHAKSQRSDPEDRDPSSQRHRTAQYEAVKEIVLKLKKLYGDDVAIILGGDYNTDTLTAPELSPIRNLLKSVFDSIEGKTFTMAERITHYFFGRDGRIGHQLDDIRVSGKIKVLDAHVVRYEDERGRIMRAPRTFEERQQQPSDHSPIVAEIEIQNNSSEILKKTTPAE